MPSDGEKYWSLVETKQLSTDKRYLFIVAVPATMQNCCGAGTIDGVLTQQGWATAGYSAPPETYAQAMQVLVSRDLPTPKVQQVIGTWKGAEGAVLPSKNGQVYFGPIYVELDAPAQPDQPAAPPTPLVKPSVWPSVIGFFAGVVLIGGTWMYVRKSMATPALSFAGYRGKR